MAEPSSLEGSGAGELEELGLELRRAAALRVLAPRGVRELAHAVIVETRPSGAILLCEGRPARSAMWILRGSAAWAEGGRPLGRSEEGASVGVLEVLAGSDGRATVTAQGDVRVARVPRERLFELLEDSFDLASALLAAIAGELSLLGARALSGAPRLALGAPLPAEVDFTERLVRLRTSRPFVRAPIRALASLARRGELVRLPRGAALWQRGAPARHIAVILAGAVREGAVTLEAGDSVGLVEALGGWRREAAAVARIPVVAHVLDVEALTDVLEDDEDLALELLRVLARELLEARIARGMPPDLSTGAPDRSLPRAARASDGSD